MTIEANEPTILPLDSPDLSLSNAGGKAANLARLVQAGFDVPNGFVLTTAAYRDFVAANDLDAVIVSATQGVGEGTPQTLDVASTRVRSAFHNGEIPANLASEIHRAYSAMGEPSVAVRSSATAEDLPTASFAGQQDTFLNVLGLDSLLDSIRVCWGSLWTARAIGYRQRQGVDPQGLALAVVVEEMVASEVSGVLFTANPLSGKRDELVIDAAFGLGEALVSGQVEPDHFVVSAEGSILTQELGSKGVALRGQQGGGTHEERADRSGEITLTESQIQALAAAGKQVQELFGQPQDIEWAWAEGQLHLLQSRPVTTLYPLPDELPSDPVRLLLSFGAVQGLLEPMTPLGRDMIKAAFAGASDLFGRKRSLAEQSVLLESGERLWVDLTPMLLNSLGRRLSLAALSFVEPATREVVIDLIAGGDLGKPGWPKLKTLASILRPILRVLPDLARTAHRPAEQRSHFEQKADQWLAGVEGDLAQVDGFDGWARVARDRARRMFVVLLPAFVPVFGVGMASYNALTKLAEGVTHRGRPIETRTMMRGLPHNVTTNMDLELWETAQQIRRDPKSYQRLSESAPADSAAAYLDGSLPPTAQRAVDEFMQDYGMRGLGEIDIGRRRWVEAPEPIFEALVSYLQISDPENAPEAIYARGKQAAQDEIDALIAGLRSTRGGWLKAHVARGAAHRMRSLLGLRETPKFTIVRMFWMLRRKLLTLAEELVQAGLLDQPEDIFFLRLSELDSIGGANQGDVVSRVDERRRAFRREWDRKQVPRLLLSDGRAIYQGMAGDDEGGSAGLIGDPVSPGMVEGAVRVVFDPGEAQMQPGEILVCPGTDPSWTPLFLAAGGLVMEVGGMMTHGAVVAREYGIPAVVGVHDATRRLQTGQWIRVDGSSGRIAILSEAEAGHANGEGEIPV